MRTICTDSSQTLMLDTVTAVRIEHSLLDHEPFEVAEGLNAKQRDFE